MSAQDTQAAIEDLRRRYEQLKAAGDNTAPRALPPLTAPGAGLPKAADILHREIIPGGWYWTAQLKRGQGLTLINTEATPGVSLFCWNAADTSERYNSADTVKVQWTAEIRRGRVLFSDMGRVMFSLVEDSCGAHDTIVGGSTPQSNLRRYGDAALRSTRENLLLAASKHGLGQRDIAPAITFFAPVSVGPDGKLGWREGVVKPGDMVGLRAELDLIVALSNCPHPLAPGEVFAPRPVEALIHTLPEAAADDACRTASAEAVRGFENNALYLRG